MSRSKEAKAAPTTIHLMSILSVTVTPLSSLPRIVAKTGLAVSSQLLTVSVVNGRRLNLAVLTGPCIYIYVYVCIYTHV